VAETVARAHDSAQREARRQQRVEELCVAAIRALSGEPDLHFRGRLLHRGRRRVPLHAPQLYPDTDDDFASFRGAADGMALRLARSDLDLHRRLAPEDRVARTLFEMLEQFRVESLAPAELPGVAANLRHRHLGWSLAFHHSGLTETSHGLLLYAVVQICRARVTGEPVVEQTEDLIEATRAGVAPLLGHDVAGLRRHRHDQRAYAVPALAIARSVARMLAEPATEDDPEHEQDDTDEPPDRVRFPLFVDFDDAEEDTLPAPASGRSTVLAGAEHGYRAFTTAYDQERDITTLVRAGQLRTLRERLDRRVAAQGVNVPRLARRLRALLAEPAADGWESGREEGYVDGRRLSQLVTSPTERRLFQVERVEPLPDCLVTFLVDCSGSMKMHAESVAMLVDVLGRALELAGIGSEVLGFTTGAWNGGRALRDWRRVGRPAYPGRLNEVTHIVFKDADTPWRRARPRIAGLLKPDLFREGVDGEAVSWAAGRMAGRPEQRRHLLVVSDGSPMDSATNLANDEFYLDNHLKEVVARHESEGLVRVHGLGVGLDLSPYYSRAHALDLSRGTPNTVFAEVVDALTGRGRR
jgi:cobaltochelatase CobT